MSYVHKLLTHDIACCYTVKSVPPKLDYEIISLASDLDLVFAFLMCIILRGKASKVTLFRSLFQEVMHHRRDHACVAVGGGMIIVNRVAGLEARLRGALTATVVSSYTLAVPSPRGIGDLLHRVLQESCRGTVTRTKQGPSRSEVFGQSL
jgi:hypothetical protein